MLIILHRNRSTNAKQHFEKVSLKCNFNWLKLNCSLIAKPENRTKSFNLNLQDFDN